MEKPSRPNKQEREFIKQTLIYDYVKTGCTPDEAEHLAEALLLLREMSETTDSESDEPEST